MREGDAERDDEADGLTALVREDDCDGLATLEREGVCDGLTALARVREVVADDDDVGVVADPPGRDTVTTATPSVAERETTVTVTPETESVHDPPAVKLATWYESSLEPPLHLLIPTELANDLVVDESPRCLS